MTIFQYTALLGLFASTISGQSQATDAVRRKAQDAVVRINQIQVIGTHNSYHAGFAPSEAALMQSKNPKALAALDYAHKPLAEQFSSGVRQIEIDVYADREGGRFAHPAIVSMTSNAKLPPDPELDPQHELDKPGFKVMHVVGIDQRTNCGHTLVSCLNIVRTWSQAHPDHLPIFILVETKQDKPNEKPRPYAVATEPFTSAVFDALDDEIRSVFSAAEMITPDQVRGTHASLPEAIAAGGWPTLSEARGKVVFLMDQSSVEAVYTAGHPALQHRVLFTNATPGAADAAFIEQNSGTPAAIDALVKQGYLVRTRTDEPTEAARTNDTSRRDEALSSGAQMLSTDYPASEPARWPGHYAVSLPGRRQARCNPVTKPATCDDALLETNVTPTANASR